MYSFLKISVWMCFIIGINFFLAHCAYILDPLALVKFIIKMIELNNFIFLFFWYHPNPNIIYSLWVRILPSFHIFFSLYHSCFYFLPFSSHSMHFQTFFSSRAVNKAKGSKPSLDYSKSVYLLWYQTTLLSLDRIQIFLWLDPWRTVS